MELTVSVKYNKKDKNRERGKKKEKIIQKKKKENSVRGRISHYYIDRNSDSLDRNKEIQYFPQKSFLFSNNIYH